MSALERLEAELQERIEDATLAIYADHLQTLGDPRGELIALDLSAAELPFERRRELLVAWLGDNACVELWSEAATWVAGDRDHTYATFDRGFMDVVHVDGDPAALSALLAGPAGRYLRRLTASGTEGGLRTVLTAVASAPRPWLEMMSLAAGEADELGDADECVVDDELHARLCTATPRLELLDVCGDVFHAFAHPAVREIAVLGTRAIGLPDGPPLPNVRTLDIAFAADEAAHRDTLKQLVTPSRFPQLRRVRLGRCEPGHRHAFRVLDALAVAPQLTHLRLPSLRSTADGVHVQAVLDRLPNLRVVEIERAYTCFPHVAGELRHPVADIRVAPLRSWRPSDQIGEDRALAFGIVEVPIGTLIAAIEDHYPELPQPVQDDWDQFWRAIATELGYHERWAPDGIWLSRGPLARALGSIAAADADLALAADHVAKLQHDTVEVGWR